MPSVTAARASTAVWRARPSSIRGVMSLKEMPGRGKSGTVWMWASISLAAPVGVGSVIGFVTGRRCRSRWPSSALSCASPPRRGGGLGHRLPHAAVVTATQFRVNHLLEEGRLAIDGRHDASQVAGLDGVLRHLQGHARDLRVALGELAAAAYHADAYELLHEAYLGLQGVRQLLAGVGPVLQDAREVAGRVAPGERGAAFDPLLDHLQGEVLFVLQGEDVAQELYVLRREQPVAAAGAA